MAKQNVPATGEEDPRRHLPSVSVLLENSHIIGLMRVHSRPLVLDAIHEALGSYRESLKPGDTPPSLDDVIAATEAHLRTREHERLRPVVNATGIILHTGLGRAPLPERAAQALAGLSRFCNLQIDLETGLRGKRNYMTEQLLCKLTGAEAAMLVNNNAAATFVILRALCHGKEVIVSRGQLIEIGGSYRLPDCIHESGAILVEVGTTNKTHLRDYKQAISDNTAAILRVNPSNYRIVGFSEDVPIADLVSLKKKNGVLVIDDLGCGALINTERYGLPHEPTAQDSIAAGADLVCFSGDKLLSGPQAGIIMGRKDLVQKIRKHPLTRMLRVCKLTDLALEQTLRLFLEPDRLVETNPTLHMITLPAETVKGRAAKLKKRLDKEASGLRARVIETESATGGGSLPDSPLKSFGLAVTAPGLSADALSRKLRQHEPPVIARIEAEEVVLDMRTLLPGDDRIIAEALVSIARQTETCGDAR